MKITHKEAVRRVRSVVECYEDNPYRSLVTDLAAAIEQAVKETAEECARICVEETIVQHAGSGYMREEWGVGTLSEAAREIRSAFGIAEVKRGDKE